VKVSLKAYKSKRVLLVSNLLSIGVGVAFNCPATRRTDLLVTSKVISGAKAVKVFRAITEKVNRVLARKAFPIALDPQKVVGLRIMACIVVEVTTGILITRLAKYRAVLITAKETCEKVKKSLP
jgi:hypothetical protein